VINSETVRLLRGKARGALPISDNWPFSLGVIYSWGAIYTSLCTKDGSINRKEKYTYKQKYTINKNESRNIEIEREYRLKIGLFAPTGSWCHISRVWQTDGQTDRQKGLSNTVHCIRAYMHAVWQISVRQLYMYRQAAPCGAGAPIFLPLVHLLPHLFPLFYLFSSFVHPFPFYQNSPTPFPWAGGHRRRPNLGLVCILLCSLCYLYSLVKVDCGVLFYLV